MENLELPCCCCNQQSCCAHCCCLYWTFYADHLVQVLTLAIPFVGVCLAPFAHIFPFVTKRSRETLVEKFDLPDDECRSSFCAHYWCFQCALLQEASLLQARSGFEPKCCCYVWCRNTCGDQATAAPLGAL